MARYNQPFFLGEYAKAVLSVDIHLVPNSLCFSLIYDDVAYQSN